jgi:hypothetical protein
MAETIKPFFCGGFSACFASFCIHPIDLIKVRLQIASGDAAPSILSIAKDIVKQDGPKGLYAGCEHARCDPMCIANALTLSGADGAGLARR